MIGQQQRIVNNNNNNKSPYFDGCRYLGQSSTMKRISASDYYIVSFIEDAIKSSRAVIITKNLEGCKHCSEIVRLFSSKCNESDLTVFDLNTIPSGLGEKIKKELEVTYDVPAPSSNNDTCCSIFIRGVHVPLEKLRHVLPPRAAE